MRLHRFYFPEKIDHRKEIIIKSSDFINQIARVFRFGIGDKLIIFDGSGNDYTCKISELITLRQKEFVRLIVDDYGPCRYIPQKEVILYQAVVKKDKFEWIVEKATELGVTGIVPFFAERSEKKNLNVERLCKIAVEASEQSGRSNVPTIYPIKQGLVEVFNMIKNDNNLSIFNNIVFHTEGSIININHFDESNSQPIAVFVGPEGGWSSTELNMFHDRKIEICTLGKQILRAETAAIVALSNILI